MSLKVLMMTNLKYLLDDLNTPLMISNINDL